jgi:hypothetical protein
LRTAIGALRQTLSRLLPCPLLHAVSRALITAQSALGGGQRQRLNRRAVLGKIGIQSSQVAAQRLGRIG